MVQELTKFKLDDVKLDAVDMFEANISIKEMFADEKRRLVWEIIDTDGGNFEWRIPGESMLYFFKGRERIENLDTGEVVEATAGDVVIYPKECYARVEFLEPTRALIVRWDEDGDIPGWPLKK